MFSIEDITYWTFPVGAGWPLRVNLVVEFIAPTMVMIQAALLFECCLRGGAVLEFEVRVIASNPVFETRVQIAIRPADVFHRAIVRFQQLIYARRCLCDLVIYVAVAKPIRSFHLI